MLTVAQQTVDRASRAVDDPRWTTQRLLDGEIPGLTVLHHGLGAASCQSLTLDSSRLRVFFLLAGAVTFSGPKGERTLGKMATYLPDPLTADLAISTLAEAQMLEFQVDMDAGDIEQLKSSAASFPFVQAYADCEKYRDFFKSEKTVSRTIVPPHLVPKFCMGSVESTGPDRIEPHAHPMLDQFFYSFGENEITLLIEDEKLALGGDTLLHIPLGSNHGVEVEEGKSMHYLWLDFFPNSRDMDYLVEVHKPV